MKKPTLDSIALKYINAEYGRLQLLAINKQLLDQVDTLIEINKELREYYLHKNETTI